MLTFNTSLSFFHPIRYHGIPLIVLVRSVIREAYVRIAERLDLAIAEKDPSLDSMDDPNASDGGEAVSGDMSESSSMKFPASMLFGVRGRLRDIAISYG